jgi:hypothetical protein
VSIPGRVSPYYFVLSSTSSDLYNEKVHCTIPDTLVFNTIILYQERSDRMGRDRLAALLCCILETEQSTIALTHELFKPILWRV